MLICGIDEAGRGPLLGPLVICGIMIEEKDIPKLQALGVKDSKLLTPKRREALFPKIKGIIKDFKIMQLQPKEIDEAVESKTTNLNWLEAINDAIIINSLKPDKAIIDCPTANTKAFKDFLTPLLKQSTELVIENKADLNYPVVSAASILAKVTRDAEIEKIKSKYGDFGSGYPADPKVKEFLKKNYKKYPEIFRKSWSTYKDMQQSKLI